MTFWEFCCVWCFKTKQRWELNLIRQKQKNCTPTKTAPCCSKFRFDWEKPRLTSLIDINFHLYDSLIEGNLNKLKGVKTCEITELFLFWILFFMFLLSALVIHLSCSFLQLHFTELLLYRVPDVFVLMARCVRLINAIFHFSWINTERNNT